MKNKLLFICCTFCCFHLNAQTLDKFEYLGEIYGNNEQYVGLYPTLSFVSNKVAPNPQNHSLKDWTGEIHYRKVNFAKHKWRFTWQQKMLVDVFLLLDRALQKGDPNAIDRKENTAFSNGVIGWMDYVVNLNEPNGRLLYAVGVNHNDYFYGSTYADTTRNGYTWATYDPQGYFLALGPTFTVNYLPSRFLMIEGSCSYSFSYKKVVDVTYATNPNPSYPLPHWGQIDLEFHTKWGFFTGCNYNWIVNRGNIPSKGKRLDVLFGFRFMI
ncbi:MAG: hypothetical protein WBM13_08895 [Bacteroidia bacterium]